MKAQKSMKAATVMKSKKAMNLEMAMKAMAAMKAQMEANSRKMVRDSNHRCVSARPWSHLTGVCCI